jgi:hypothetical protein
VSRPASSRIDITRTQASALHANHQGSPGARSITKPAQMPTAPVATQLFANEMVPRSKAYVATRGSMLPDRNPAGQSRPSVLIGQ